MQSASDSTTPNSAPAKDSKVALDNSNSKSGKPKGFKERKLGPNGEKRNFYNPPGKVMRHLAQQSYYDSFYGNSGQFYNLK